MKQIDYNNFLYIEGDESGDMGDYPTLWDTYKALKEIKEFDKRNKIEDTYHIYWVHGDVEQELSIRKYKNTLKWKIIG